MLFITFFLIASLYVLFVWGQFLQKRQATIQIISYREHVLNQNTPKTQSVPDSNLKQGTDNTKAFVASSRGKYYYPINCSRAKSLSIQNMLYFKDKISAEAAGYIAHSDC